MTKKTQLTKGIAARARNIAAVEGSDGSMSCRVQFRIRVKGVQISKARTLSTPKTAKARQYRTWAEIELHGVSPSATDGRTLRDAIKQRLSVHTNLGRSTREALNNIATRPFGDQALGALTTAALMDLAMTLTGEEKLPQTVAGYMMTLAGTFDWASKRSFEIPAGVVRDAIGLMWEDEIIAKSDARTRRSGLDELEPILSAMAATGGSDCPRRR